MQFCRRRNQINRQYAHRRKFNAARSVQNAIGEIHSLVLQQWFICSLAGGAAGCACDAMRCACLKRKAAAVFACERLTSRRLRRRRRRRQQPQQQQPNNGWPLLCVRVQCNAPARCRLSESSQLQTRGPFCRNCSRCFACRCQRARARAQATKGERATAAQSSCRCGFRPLKASALCLFAGEFDCLTLKPFE